MGVDPPGQCEEGGLISTSKWDGLSTSPLLWSLAPTLTEHMPRTRHLPGAGDTGQIRQSSGYERLMSTLNKQMVTCFPKFTQLDLSEDIVALLQ